MRGQNAGAIAQRLQFAQRRHCRCRRVVVALHEAHGIGVCFVFLALRELGIDQRFGKAANRRGAQLRHRLIAAGGSQTAHARGGVGHLHGFLGVPQLDVADFMADDKAHFVVGHRVQQAGVHPHRAIGHGKGVDLFGQVYLEIQRQAVFLIQPFHNARQALGVRAVGRGDFILAVHVLGGVKGQFLGVVVAERGGLG